MIRYIGVLLYIISYRNVVTADKLILVFQTFLTQGRAQINEECDSLTREIDNRRNYFMADLEYDVNKTNGRNQYERKIQFLQKNFFLEFA